MIGWGIAASIIGGIFLLLSILLFVVRKEASVGNPDYYTLLLVYLGIGLVGIAMALYCFGVIDDVIDKIGAIGLILGLFGLAIVAVIVYGFYRGLGPRRFGICCLGLAYIILWIIVLCNSTSIVGEYAWVLNLLPGVLLILHFTVKIHKLVTEKRIGNAIYYYHIDGDGITDREFYNIQKKLTHLTGKKKYLFGLKRALAEKKDLAFEKRVLAEDSTGFEGLIYEKEANWGTKAGIAGGLFGTAAGIAVAADEIAKTEQYNQMAREHNTRLINSGWRPGGVKAAREREAGNLAADVNYLSRIYRSVKDAQIVFNPDEKAHITVKYDAPNSSGYMGLLISNKSEPVKIGNASATLDGTYKIQVLDSHSRIVGDAYYNPPGFAEINLCDVGFSKTNQLRVVAAPKKGYRFSSKEKYTFEITPIKVWKITQNCEQS